MINKIFKDINTNSFYTNIVISVLHKGEKQVIAFDGIIKSGYNNLNIKIPNSLHVEANVMYITLIPKIKDALPLVLKFIGTWDEFLSNIRLKLLDLNRLPELLNTNLTYHLNEQDTKVVTVIKTLKDSKSEFLQLITQTNPLYASIEKTMIDIRSFNNKEEMKLFSDYLYELMVSK